MRGVGAPGLDWTIAPWMARYAEMVHSRISSTAIRRAARWHRLVAVTAALVACVPATACAQAPATTVTGIVFDSLARRPLRAARVELVNADNPAAPVSVTETDSVGIYRLSGIAPGRYLAAFTHPILDSIGIERPPREVRVDGRVPAIRVDLALPSTQSLRLALCGNTAVVDSTALILGIIRDAASGATVPASTVTVQWVNVILVAGGLRRNIERRTFDTQETGWYALCGAPAAGTVVLTAGHDADSTEALELELPGDGFLRRDLWLGKARDIAGDSAVTAPRAATDSLAPPARPRRAGTGRISGTVVTADGARPLPNADVIIGKTQRVRTDERGVFTLAGIPTGTRMMDVRALGYAPITLPVDVIDGAAPLRIALVSLKAMLDTVTVRGRLAGSVALEGFERRRKHSGANGRFMTAEDIAKRNPIQVADMFRSMPGILIARDANGDEILVQRNFFLNLYTTQSPFCRVSVFLNGTRLNDMTVGMLNGMLQVKTLLGIEVYSGATTPPEFSRRDGCGSVVVWTR